MKSLSVICLSLILVSTLTCKKEESQSDVPNVLVDFTIYLSQPSNVNLNVVGGWVYFPYGVKGIVVYRSGQESFVALERNCTYQSNNSSAIVSVDTANTLFLKDTSCGSKFYLQDGSVANGPATIPLKQYHTSYNSATLTVHVYN